MIGETIGNYRVIAKLGEGGMGAVFLAEHVVLGRKVAVKVLRPEGAANQEMLHRFFLEARSTASLQHPALVDVFDYGFHTNESPYIIMEYVEGESLAARIQRMGKLPIPMVVDVARQIAAGMGMAHLAGLVHRDLKPGNIQLAGGRKGQSCDTVKILDFGIAKLMSPDPITGPLTQMSAFLGTPMYMAPEQCLGAGNVDHRSDIYALGCMMYEMACGRPPFVAPAVRELIAGHLRGTPPPPRSLRPDIPADLAAIILKALAKTPASRQKNMSELADDLARCARGLPASSRPGERWAPGESSSAASIFPVSKPADDSRSLTESIRPSDVRKATGRAWIAIGAFTIALSALAAFWVERRSAAPRSEATSPASVAPVVAMPTGVEAPLPLAASAVLPAAELPREPESKVAAPPASAKLLGPRPHVSLHPLSAEAGARAAPGPTPSSRPPDPAVPSLGGEEVENPWPN
jgi:serine/threonine-protein kinase